MSEASKERALAHAVAHYAHREDANPQDVIGAAEIFHDFISQETAPAKSPTPGKKPAAPATGKPAAAKPAAGKPAATKPKKPAPPAEETEDENSESAEDDGTEESAAEGPTKEDVGNAIASLLNSNLKKECGKLLGEYGAKSLSGIPEESYAEFIEKAEELLMNA